MEGFGGRPNIEQVNIIYNSDIGFRSILKYEKFSVNTSSYFTYSGFAVGAFYLVKTGGKCYPAQVSNKINID